MKVFVYGTLLRGEANHRLLEHSTFVGYARTPAAYRLHSLGGFPGMVLGGNSIVEGEVYDVDVATLARLDRLEGHPSFYRRMWIRLGNGTRALTYLLPQHRVSERAVIASGNWRDHRREEERTWLSR